MALALSGQRTKSYHRRTRGTDDHERGRSFPAVSTPKSASVGGRVQTSKWYKEPRIPIHMNMSTMIRMKSKESKCTEDDRSSSTLYGDNDRRKASSFSPPRSNLRMFDYMQRKFETVKDEKFFGSTYTKNLFWGMVAEHESRHNLAANACGDGGFPASGTYQRVAAINVQAASGCNLQYIERISIHSKTKSNGNRGQQIRGDSDMGCATDTFKNLRISKAGDVGCGESGGRELRGRKKKVKKSARKAVVVTCLKNTSIKYVRK